MESQPEPFENLQAGLLCVGAIAALGMAYALGMLPAWSGFGVWSVALGLAGGELTGRLRVWMERYPATGPVAGRRQIRLTAVALLALYSLLLARLSPLFIEDLRAWCLDLARSATLAAVHAGGMTLTMAAIQLWLPLPAPPPSGKRHEIARMGWAIVTFSFLVFYGGLVVCLVLLYPDVVPLMLTLFLTPSCFCMRYYRHTGAPAR